jgi:NADPH:quinone reductase-like Zn-dependent oxidoreductase
MPEHSTDPPEVYEILLKGQLDTGWSEWFGGMAVAVRDGDTLLTGAVADQAALHGLFKTVRDLGMPLLSVTRVAAPAVDPAQSELPMTMQAFIAHHYGQPDTLRFESIERPTPKDDEVLLAVHAASVNAADWWLLIGKPFLVRLSTGALTRRRHAYVGSDVAGRVEAVGAGVTRFKVGESVFGAANGSFAEYATASESDLVPMPANITFEQAAASPMASLTVLQTLRDTCKLQAGQRVLIAGAAGGVGTFAVQMAKSMGAHVTAVCSTRNIDMVRGLGADQVIDYTKEDFTKNGERYDVIVGVNGYHKLAEYQRSLTPRGIYACAGGTMPQIFETLAFGRFYSEKNGRTLTNVMAAHKQDDLMTVRNMLETGAIKPVIERTYPLREVPEAMRYLGSRHARAKLVIKVRS